MTTKGVSLAENLRGRREGLHADTAVAVAMVGDFAMIVLGLVTGFYLRFHTKLLSLRIEWLTADGVQERALRDYAGLIAVGAILLFLTFLKMELYRPRNLLRFRQVAGLVTRGAVYWFLAYLCLSLVLKFTPPISRLYVLCSFVGSTIFVLSWRAVFHRVLQSEALARHLRQRVLFVGWNDEAARLAQEIHADQSQPYTIIGCLPSPNGTYQKRPGKLIRELGDYQELPDILPRDNIDIVVLCDLDTSTGEIIGLTNLCERELIQFKVIPSYFQIMVSGLKLETISGVPILGVTELPLERLGNRILKRTVDLVGAVIGLLGSIPLLIFFGLAVFAENPGPIFFRQERVGRGGRRFTMWKLRSMKLGADKDDHLSQSTRREDPRLLRVGAFVRRWNIDETPQFWNVLKGHMSLVGPRPERTFHSEKLSHEIPHYNARLTSKPGITGWAQINGLRGDTDLTERVRYDLYYLENWTLWLDIQIMVQTFISRKNAY